MKIFLHNKSQICRTLYITYKYGCGMTNLMLCAARTIVVTKLWASLCNLCGEITTQLLNEGITNIGLPGKISTQ
jgi:hypothetical protein